VDTPPLSVNHQAVTTFGSTNHRAAVVSDTPQTDTHKMNTIKMMNVVASVVLVASGAPQSHTREEIDLLLALQPEDANLIHMEDISKEKSVPLAEDIPLGSQFAVAHLFPEREGLVTGHRIPLHLFPLETQSRILEVPSVVTQDTPVFHTGVISRENIQHGRYVDTASFRRTTAAAAAVTAATATTEAATTLRSTPTTTTTTESTSQSPPQIRDSSVFLDSLGDESEIDVAYTRSLRIFAPPSFF